MTHPLCFDNLDVGARWVSRGRTVTETDVINFAGISGDFDPLHVDRQHAQGTPFGKPIAHGLLGLSLVSGLGSTCPTVDTIAFVEVRDWKFLKPLFIGDTVHCVSEIIEKRPRGRRAGEVIWRRQLVNHEGAVVQEGLFVTLVATAVRSAEATRGPGRATQGVASTARETTPQVSEPLSSGAVPPPHLPTTVRTFPVT